MLKLRGRLEAVKGGLIEPGVFREAEIGGIALKILVTYSNISFVQKFVAK